MVLSYEWQELHLTPSGWEEGTFKVDSGYQKEVIPPKDRVLTMRIEETIDAPFQEIETDISEIWRSSDDKLINQPFF